MTDLRPLSFGDHVSLFEILDHHKWYARTPGCKFFVRLATVSKL